MKRLEHIDSRKLLESAPDAMIVVDQHATIVLINSQMERLFGYSQQDLAGETIEILMPERFRAKHAKNRIDYCASPRFRSMGIGLELLGQSKSGVAFPVEVSLSPLDTPEGLLVTAAIRDMTERK